MRTSIGKRKLMGSACLTSLVGILAGTAPASAGAPLRSSDFDAASPALLAPSDPKALSACALDQLNGKRDIFYRLEWLRACNVLRTDEDMTRYAPGFRTIEDAYARAEGIADAQQRKMILDGAYTQVASETWTYPVFMDPTMVGQLPWAPVPDASGVRPASPVWAPNTTGKLSLGVDEDTEELVRTKLGRCFDEVHPAATAMKVAAVCAGNREPAFLNPYIPNGPTSINARCHVEDALGTRAQVDDRNDWALQCGHIEREDYDGFYLVARQGVVQPREKVEYASFAYNDTTNPDRTKWYPAFLPEPAGKIVRDGATRRFTNCSIPANVFFYAQCQIGCFAPEQKILFDTGELAIERAVEQGKLGVITLAPDATFDELRLMKNRVESFTADVKEQEQPVVVLTTSTGARLRVTPHHPMVSEDGTIKAAKDFQPGDRLVRVDGAFDELVSVEKETFRGRVYNVTPVSTDDTSNVLVAEGYLTASQRYQSEDERYINRRIVRKYFPADVLP